MVPPTQPAAAPHHGSAVAGQLALELMHEVRNPLESVVYLTQMAIDDVQEPEKALAHLHLVKEQLHLLTAIVNQTLGFARSTPAPKEADLVALAEAALRIHQRTIVAKQIHLVKDLPSTAVAEVRMDQVLQVVSNLIVNALDALPASGTLHVRIRSRAKGVHILIADNGHGISPEHAGEIFEPFFTTKEERGIGLGLALSKKIIEGHRGQIRVRSCTKAGKSGTTFRLMIPLSA